MLGGASGCRLGGERRNRIVIRCSMELGDVQLTSFGLLYAGPPPRKSAGLRRPQYSRESQRFWLPKKNALVDAVS